MPWWLLARRLHVVRSAAASVGWCLVARVLGGPGVALPFGPQAAPVWLFAIIGSTVLCLPVVATPLTLVERQAVRCSPRLAAARTATYLAVVVCSLAAFTGPEPAPSVVAVAVLAATAGVVLAVMLGEASVVVLLAGGLVLVFCSTRPWFVDVVLDVDRRPAWTAVPLIALVVACAVSVHIAARPSSGIR